MPVVGQLLCRVFASLADVSCAVLPVAEFFAALPDGSDATLMMVNGRVSPRHVSATNECGKAFVTMHVRQSVIMKS
jgi:hypothetical protein